MALAHTFVNFMDSCHKSQKKIKNMNNKLKKLFITSRRYYSKDNMDIYLTLLFVILKKKYQIRSMILKIANFLSPTYCSMFFYYSSTEYKN